MIDPTFLFKVVRVGNEAIRQAQENNRKKGIPNVYSINGTMVFELPNGEITTHYDFPDIEEILKQRRAQTKPIIS